MDVKYNCNKTLSFGYFTITACKAHNNVSVQLQTPFDIRNGYTVIAILIFLFLQYDDRNMGIYIM